MSETYSIIVNGTENTYFYNEKVTVCADAEKDGQSFSYWQRSGEIVSYNAEYSFYVSGNATLDAVYGKEISSTSILTMATPVLVDENRIAFFAERDIDSAYDIIETGIIMGTSPALTVKNAQYKATSTSSANKGQFTVRKKNLSLGDTYYACAYAICSDENGNMITLYSNEVSYTVK